MPTRPVEETLINRLKAEPELQKLTLISFLESLMEGEEVEARLLMRNLVNATIGFVELSNQLDKDPKSLMRMLSTKGNPTNENLFQIFRVLKDHLQVNISVSVSAA